jgi:hypothetical protein
MKAVSIFFLFALSINLSAADLMEPPMPPSPIAEFRGWLTNSPEVRKIALAKRSAASREMIERKIQVYIDLDPAERERRLTATELQWYVSQLVKINDKVRRDAALQLVPVLWRPMVMERLFNWDKMSPDLQREALAHQLVMEYVSTPADKKEAVLKSLSVTSAAALRNRIAQWQVLPAVERARLDERLGEFFRMPAEKQQQTLDNFSETERRNMEKTLDSFRTLSREQREVCIRSFAQLAQKFGSLDDADKIAFLKNADRWQEMSQKDRDMWRKIVTIVPPMPPVPIQLPPSPPGATVATPPTP